VRDTADEILTEKCTFIDSNMFGSSKGIEECVEYITRLRSAFPNWKVVNEMIEENSPNESTLE
jgi:hypothetical protein